MIFLPNSAKPTFIYLSLSVGINLVLLLSSDPLTVIVGFSCLVLSLSISFTIPMCNYVPWIILRLISLYLYCLLSNQFVLVFLPHRTFQVRDVRGNWYVRLLILLPHLKSLFQTNNSIYVNILNICQEKKNNKYPLLNAHPIQPELWKRSSRQRAKWVEVEVARVAFP